MKLLENQPLAPKQTTARDTSTEIPAATMDRARSHLPPSDSDDSSRPKKKKKSVMAKLNASLMMCFRRIHLFTGLFMLPWVLLYGFTALVFNHSTWFSDSRIEHFQLDEERLSQLPASQATAHDIIKTLQAEGMDVKLADDADAWYTRSAFGNFVFEDADETVVLDLNTGKGYRRIREKKIVANQADRSPKSDLKNGAPITLPVGNHLDISDIVADWNPTQKIDENQFRFQSIPTLEFNAVVEGTTKRLRFSPNRGRRESNSRNRSSQTAEPAAVKGSVSIVGENPREMSWRSYLLRLHTAHGYPNSINARYWWAYAVDAMFLCMVFWGLSGVFMWWQIKRTRKLGFIVLAISGFVATYLAIAMHWQLANG